MQEKGLTVEADASLTMTSKVLMDTGFKGVVDNDRRVREEVATMILAGHRSNQKPGFVAMTAPDFLNKAEGHMRDRAATYDKPQGERSMCKTVEIFNAYHGTELTEAQGWHFQQILKDVRLFSNPGFHQDSAEDCIAYASLKAEAKQKEAV